MALTTAQINDQLRKLDPDLATKYGGYFLRRDLDGPTGFFMASVLAHLPCQNFKRGLDVGSGLGHWLAILQDRTFCQMEAVEPSAEKNATAAKMLEAFGLHAVFLNTYRVMVRPPYSRVSTRPGVRPAGARKSTSSRVS